MSNVANHEEVWNNCLAIIKDNISEQSFKTWFLPIKPIKLKNNILTIQVQSQFFYEWLEEHYVSILRKTIMRELGNDARLEYSIVVEHSSNQKPTTVNFPNLNHGNSDNPESQAPLNISNDIKNPFIIPGLKKVKIESNLSFQYTFDSLVEGDCNRLARNAGYAVATKPLGTCSFNPFVLYGGVGLGKTHLAQAIGNKFRETFPNKTVLYVTSDKFTNQFIESLKNNSTVDFIHYYQVIDVLIVDDIQFLANKGKTQDIFFQIFNHLHQNNKQIILTSDRLPRDLEGLEERLLSRFKWGLSADLKLPDFETRIAILENKMYADGIELTKDVVEYIAYNIQTNVRELEGALIALLAQSSFNKTDINIDIAKKIIKDFVKNATCEVSIEFIQKLVCDHFNIVPDKLKDKTRKRNIVEARQISMYLAKCYTKNSLKAIGGHFGGRDHSTVIHSCQAVQDQIDTDASYGKNVAELEKKIQLSIT